VDKSDLGGGILQAPWVGAGFWWMVLVEVMIGSLSESVAEIGLLTFFNFGFLLLGFDRFASISGDVG
jgi:hypothetical protein